MRSSLYAAVFILRIACARRALADRLIASLLPCRVRRAPGHRGGLPHPGAPPDREGEAGRAGEATTTGGSPGCHTGRCSRQEGCTQGGRSRCHNGRSTGAGAPSVGRNRWPDRGQQRRQVNAAGAAAAAATGQSSPQEQQRRRRRRGRGCAARRCCCWCGSSRCSRRRRRPAGSRHNSGRGCDAAHAPRRAPQPASGRCLFPRRLGLRHLALVPDPSSRALCERPDPGRAYGAGGGPSGHARRGSCRTPLERFRHHQRRCSARAAGGAGRRRRAARGGGGEAVGL